jgi:uncharacterized protein YxjI
MKQKIFSWNDKFFVNDEHEAERYYVEGELFALGKKLHVFDSSQHEVAFIRQKLLALLPRYFIEIGGNTFEIVKEFTFLKPSFHFEGLTWTLKGDFFAHEYTLLDGDRVMMMQLSKKWLTWGDTYELDIADPNSEVLCLCVALTVDCVLDAQDAGASAASN